MYSHLKRFIPLQIDIIYTNPLSPTGKKKSYKYCVNQSPPAWHSRNISLVSIDFFPVEFATASIDIDILGTQPTLTLPEEAIDPEEEDDREGEVGLEETGCVVDATFRWGDGYKELDLIIKKEG